QAIRNRRHSQRIEPTNPLARRTQWYPTCCQNIDLRRALQNGFDCLGDRVNDVLAVVEHNQYVSRFEVFDHTFQWLFIGRRKPQKRRKMRWDEWAYKRSKVGKEDAVSKLARKPVGRGQRDERLTNAAGPGYGDETPAGSLIGKLADFRVAADDFEQRKRHIIAATPTRQLPNILRLT